MFAMIVRLLVVLLALAVSPLHAASVLHAGAPTTASGVALGEMLSELPAPLTEEAFFEAVNAAGAGIYSVGTAQGTQAMVVSISITVPGNPPLTASDADAPLTGTPPSSAVDSFFDASSPTLVWGYDQEPNVLAPQAPATGGDAGEPGASVPDPPGEGGAGSDLPEVQTEIVELDLRSVDPMVSVDPDWYQFTLDGPPTTTTAPALDTVETEIVRLDLSGSVTLTDDAVGVGLFDLGGPLSLCGSDPGAPLCSQVGGIITSAVDLLNDCAGIRSEVCTEIVSLDLVGTPDAHVIILDGFNDAPGPYTLQISEDAIGLCTSDDRFAAPAPECGDLLDLTGSLLGFDEACNGNPTALCDLNRPGSVLDQLQIDGLGGDDDLTIDATDDGQLRSIFAQLPDGSVLIADGYHIRPAPDGSFLYRDEGGRVYTLTTMPPSAAPDWYPQLIELTVFDSDAGKTVLTADDGTRIVIPAPDAELIDINADPGAIATTPDEIVAATSGEGATVIGMVTSTGGSTGEVFDLSFINLGKTAAIEGDAIFEPLTDEQANAARNALAGLMGAANSVTNAAGTAYCVEQDKAVPAAGQLFSFANSGKQQELAFARQVLAGARAAEAAGLLDPDSDPTAYTHSIRQWSIWTAEKSLDKDGFTNSFLEHTRKALTEGGAQWSPEIENAVRDLIDNRWADIQQVLNIAGLAQANSASPAPVAALPFGSVAVLLGALLATVLGRPRARQ